VFNVNTNIKCRGRVCSSFRGGIWKLTDRQSLFWYYSFHALLLQSVTFTNKCTQRDYKLYISFKNSYISASRRQPQGVTSTVVYKHQYINLGSTMPSVKMYCNYKIRTMLSVKLQHYPHYMQCMHVNIRVHPVQSKRIQTARGWRLSTDTYRNF